MIRTWRTLSWDLSSAHPSSGGQDIWYGQGIGALVPQRFKERPAAIAPARTARGEAARKRMSRASTILPPPSDVPVPLP